MPKLSPSRSPLLLLLAASLASCASARRDFDPPLTAENEVARVEVTRSQMKKDDLRIWLTLVNKTNETIVCAKDHYVALVDGRTYKGYSGHGIKISKGYEFPPNVSKKIKFAYVGVPKDGGEAELRFEPIEVRGKDTTYSLSVKVPYGAETDEGTVVDDQSDVQDEEPRQPDK